MRKKKEKNFNYYIMLNSEKINFGGNEIAGEVIDGHFIGQMAIANQIVKPSELNKLDNAYGKYGQTSLHEITEAYIGARLSMERGHSSIGTGMNSYIFQEAHEAAIPQAGPVLYGCFENKITGEMWIEWQDNKGNLLKDLDIPNSK